MWAHDPVLAPLLEANLLGLPADIYRCSDLAEEQYILQSFAIEEKRVFCMKVGYIHGVFNI